MPVEKVVRGWQLFYDPPYSGSNHCGLYDDPAFELILYPHARFFYDPPPSLSLTNDIMAVAFFFLTRHITAGEMNF